MTAYDRWLDHCRRWKDCQECDLCTQRDKIVLARGVLPADVLLLGEAPGESENVHGLPFWGPAGDLLEGIMVQVRTVVGVPFTEAYTNLCCCFPAVAKQTSDHRPTQEQIMACSPRLQEFVELAQPKLIVCVGDTADEWGAICCGAQPGVQWLKITHPAAILRQVPLQRSATISRCVQVLRDAVAKVMQKETCDAGTE